MHTGRKNSRRKNNGFALLVVMLLVAFIGIGAAALLDLVNVDIIIAGENRKSVQAEGASVGAVLETIGMEEFDGLLPSPSGCANLTTPMVQNPSAGTYTFGPAESDLPEGDSAYIDYVGTQSEEGYESDVSLLRIVPRENTSYQFAVAVYEVRALASIARGAATREARSLIYRPVAVGADKAVRQCHAR